MHNVRYFNHSIYDQIVHQFGNVGIRRLTICNTVLHMVSNSISKAPKDEDF